MKLVDKLLNVLFNKYRRYQGYGVGYKIELSGELNVIKHVKEFYQKLSDLGKSPNQYLLGDEKANNLSLEECLRHPNYQYFNPIAHKRLFEV